MDESAMISACSARPKKGKPVQAIPEVPDPAQQSEMPGPEACQRTQLTSFSILFLSLLSSLLSFPPVAPASFALCISFNFLLMAGSFFIASIAANSCFLIKNMGSSRILAAVSRAVFAFWTAIKSLWVLPTCAGSA